jgi:hypothetical protein
VTDPQDFLTVTEDIISYQFHSQTGAYEEWKFQIYDVFSSFHIRDYKYGKAYVQKYLNTLQYKALVSKREIMPHHAPDTKNYCLTISLEFTSTNTEGVLFHIVESHVSFKF